jgi:hypothetical protein
MTDRKMFSDADVDTRRFYSRIINTAMFNLYAVEHQMFGEVFCESDDPMIMERWAAALDHGCDPASQRCGCR